MVWLRKWTILIHRYLGIGLGLLVVMWFLSGIAMIYAGGMPELTQKERLGRMPALDLRRVRLTAAAAARATGDSTVRRARLSTVMDRPAYRFSGATVFADTGQMLDEIAASDAVAIASRFLKLPAARVHHIAFLDEPDQWTLGQRRDMPLHKFSVDDDAATEVYVSGQSAEVVMMTTRRTRALAWMAAIPHWLYFVELRKNDWLWRQVVLWTSGIGIGLALLGLTLAVAQYRVAYVGLMRWHYVTGVLFGVFTLTWVFSGFLSMQPWDWSSGGGTGSGIRQALAGAPLDLSRFPAFDPSAWDRALPRRDVKEIDFVMVQGEPHYGVRAGSDPAPTLVAASPLEVRRDGFPIDALLAAVKRGSPDASIVRSQLLSEFDAYYYSRASRPPLPVLRIEFDDPDATWFYIDPHMGQAVVRFTRRERIERWIYHGLHSLDFPFWYYSRPAWDAGVIALCGGGALSSGIGLFVGLRRMKRKVVGRTHRVKSVHIS